MGGGHFNLNQATKAIKHAAHTTVDLANPLSDVYQPAPGRSRTDQLRTIGRKTGSTLKETGNVVEKAGDVISEGSKYVGYAAAAGEVVGMGLTFLGPEGAAIGIPLMEASTAVAESDALGAAVLGGPALQSGGAWMQDIGSGLRNVSKGAKKGVSQEHSNQLAVTNAGYKYTRNMHLGMPKIPNLTMDNDFAGDRRHVVYTHDNENKVYISYTGANYSKKADLDTMANIIRGDESKSKRFQVSEALFDEVKEKYPNHEIHLMGHGSGGTQAAYVGCRNKAASVTTFNRAGHFLKSDVNNKNCTSNVTNYKTRSDPMSTGSYALPNQKLIVLQGSGRRDPHSMHNFNVV